MKHRRLKAKLSLSTSNRQALLRNLAASLFLHQRLTTTKSNAKEARRFAEKLITLTKDDGFYAMRRAISLLGNTQAVKCLFKEIAPLFKERHGGYTRIIKLGRRKGDGAEMVILELTEKKLETPKVKTEKKIKPQELPKGVLPKSTAERKPEKMPPKIEKPKKGFFEDLRKIFRRKV